MQALRGDNQAGPAGRECAAVPDSTEPDFVFSLADKFKGFIAFWVNAACVAQSVPCAAARANTHVRIATAYTIPPHQGRITNAAWAQGRSGARPSGIAIFHSQQHCNEVRRGRWATVCIFLVCLLFYELPWYEFRFVGPLMASTHVLGPYFVKPPGRGKVQQTPGCAIRGASLATARAEA